MLSACLSACSRPHVRLVDVTAIYTYTLTRVQADLLSPCLNMAYTSLSISPELFVISRMGSWFRRGQNPIGEKPISIRNSPTPTPCRSDAPWHLLHHCFVGSPDRGSSMYASPSPPSPHSWPPLSLSLTDSSVVCPAGT
ncbi:hypothetical protein LX32DRAFT_10989 [Colletotrichum zoysiae]|uniref:Uncharacterized protein n=1 Tax=Colletotrichum zoysiae TaxID=1216348 RepID=A0AAD9HF16_9PEZI|nr:hypothetical protein LX32DRAFT_10989 [Colletotrichum zoysiae]